MSQIQIYAQQWDELAPLLAQHETVACDASRKIIVKIFEATGARPTANSFGPDITSRAMRTHAVKDPVSFGARAISTQLPAAQVSRLRTVSQPVMAGSKS